MRKSEMAARGARNSNVQALTDEEHWQIHRQCVLFWERPSGGRDFYQELRRNCEARDPSFAKPKKVKAGKPAATEKKEEGAAASTIRPFDRSGAWSVRPGPVFACGGRREETEEGREDRRAAGARPDARSGDRAA